MRTLRRKCKLSLLGFCAVVLVGLVAWERASNLSWYMRRLNPFMTHKEVTRIIPSRFLLSEHAPVSGPGVGTMIAAPATQCVFSISYGAATIFGSESGVVYFDASNRLVGIYYSSSGGRSWTPAWGEKYH